MSDENQKLKHLNDDNFESTISKGVTLVDFYADWCGPCRMIAPIIEDLAKEYQGKATVAKIDIENAQKTTASFGVTSIPTVIVFKDGKEFKKVIGVRGKDEYSKMIASAI
jgi:thioredoxin 1